MASTKNTSTRGASSPIFYVGALFAVTAWGESFISTRVLLDNGLNAVEIYIYRFILAYLLTLLVCPKPFMSHSWGDEFKFMICGICGGSVYFIAENTALLYTLASNVSLLVAIAPLITALLLGLFYKNDRPTKGVLIGSAIAFAGVGCVVFNSSFVVKLNPLGDLLGLLAAVCWAVYTIVLRPLNATYSSWFVTRKTFFYGVVTALPFLALEPSLAPMTTLLRPTVAFNLLFLGLVASMASYWLWAISVKRLGTMTASNFLYLSPIVTLVLSAIVLDERVSFIGYLGCALILIGLIFSERFDRFKLRGM